MVRLLAVLLLAGGSVKAQTITQTFGSGADAFSIDFVEVGNPGNAADTTGSPNPVGSVPYVYNLGKFEVSRDMVLKASTAGGLGLTLEDITNYGGNGANRPATGVSWNEAARFVNWLNTSKGYQAAYNFTTSGANDNITLWGAGLYTGSNPYRHKDAYYFLPSVNEWYKAAYGSPNGTFYNYPTAGDTIPTAVSGGTISGTAIYNGQNGPSDITNAGGLSGFGTMAQGGNVWEWTETAYWGVNNAADDARILRGGSWVNDITNLDALNLFGLFPNDETSFSPFIGFRVASVPEPSSLSLLLAGGAVFAAARRRRLV